MTTAHTQPRTTAWLKWLPFYLVLCVSYLCNLSADYPWQFLHKAMPVVFLLLPAWLLMAPHNRSPLFWALLFSASGDMLLASQLPFQFELGLGAFLFAHLAYVWLMWPQAKIRKGDKFGLTLSLLLLIAVANWLLPYTEQMLIPVAIYMLVIGVMAICAFLNKPHNRWLVLGAGTFMLSDTLIAVNKFVQPLPNASMYIMISYYSAQYLLVFALIQQSKSR